MASPWTSGCSWPSASVSQGGDPCGLLGERERRCERQRIFPNQRLCTAAARREFAVDHGGPQSSMKTGPKAVGHEYPVLAGRRHGREAASWRSSLDESSARGQQHRRASWAVLATRAAFSSTRWRRLSLSPSGAARVRATTSALCVQARRARTRKTREPVRQSLNRC